MVLDKGTLRSGLAVFPTTDSVAPGTLAGIVEERGHESLFFAEHTHIPASRETPYPDGGELPGEYARTYDVFVACTAAAAATSRLRIGSGICRVTERDPIITAKEVASIDCLSGGRFEFGVGAGWNREEMANHGTDPRRRMTLLTERVEAMKKIWTEKEAGYHGEFVDFERIWSWPKPAQRPHPPILVGGSGPSVLDRVLRFGDAWFPICDDRDALSGRIEELRSRAERPIDIQVMAVPADAAVLEAMANIGVTRAVHLLPTADRPKVESAMERWEHAFDELNGRP